MKMCKIEDIRDGWYMIEYSKNDYWMQSDYWPPNDEIARVENGLIVEHMSPNGDYMSDCKVCINTELIPCMTPANQRGYMVCLSFKELLARAEAKVKV